MQSKKVQRRQNGGRMTEERRNGQDLEIENVKNIVFFIVA